MQSLAETHIFNDVTSSRNKIINFIHRLLISISNDKNIFVFAMMNGETKSV